jgi:hypothetical protein
MESVSEDQAGFGAPRDLTPVIHEPGLSLPASISDSVDIALGAAATIVGPVVAVGKAVAYVATPAAQASWEIVKHPPLVPPTLSLGGILDRLADRGRDVRQSATGDLSHATADTLDAIVPDLVPTIVGQIVDRIDVTSLVLDAVDVDRIVRSALDGMDLTEVVLTRVDLEKIVNQALDGLDLTELVRSRVDVAGLAQDVIDDVDLPEIIRESTTGVAADAVNQGRLVALSGDELVNHWVDKFLLRRRRRNLDAGGGNGAGR